MSERRISNIAASRRGNRSRRARWLLRWTILCAAALLACGCQQGRIYRASSLPPNFLAPPVSSLRNVDLSRFAQSRADNERLYAGDIVEVSIATGLEEGDLPVWKLRIAEDGTVNVPLVGNVGIAGLELTEAEMAIRTESIRRGKFVDPNVSLLMLQRRSNRITIAGAVEQPGVYELPRTSSDLLAALVAAGGPTAEAGTIVEIRQPAPEPHLAARPQFASFAPGQSAPASLRIDLQQAMRGGAPDLRLPDGAAVMIEKRPTRYVHVIGLVNQANQFEMPADQELRLLDAIAMAGGRTLSIADKVQVVRTLPGATEPILIEASVNAAKRDGASNIVLAAGDVVSVEETPLTFTVGTIREFVRFGFSSALPGF